jgi:hypothetical protein
MILASLCLDRMVRPKALYAQLGYIKRVLEMDKLSRPSAATWTNLAPSSPCLIGRTTWTLEVRLDVETGMCRMDWDECRTFQIETT